MSVSMWERAISMLNGRRIAEASTNHAKNSGISVVGSVIRILDANEVFSCWTVDKPEQENATCKRRDTLFISSLLRC